MPKITKQYLVKIQGEESLVNSAFQTLGVYFCDGGLDENIEGHLNNEGHNAAIQDSTMAETIILVT